MKTSHVLQKHKHSQYSWTQCQKWTITDSEPHLLQTAITLSRDRSKTVNQCQRDKRTPQLNPRSGHLHPYSCARDAFTVPMCGERERQSGGIHWSCAASGGFQREGRRRGDGGENLCGSRTVKTLLSFDGQPVRSFLRTIVDPENKLATTAPVIHLGWCAFGGEAVQACLRVHPHWT